MPTSLSAPRASICRRSQPGEASTSIAVAETDLEAERMNGGNLNDLVHSPTIVLLPRRQ
jgi:hypothetical protein